MLLHIPSKVLRKVILERLKEVIDKRLRPEQAGFCQDRSCTDHTTTLCIIIEQSAEWQSSLSVTFVDFVDRDVIWRLMNPYGIPPEVINIIQGVRRLILLNYPQQQIR